MESEKKDIIVSLDMLNKVFQYLAGRPWAETNALIVELEQVVRNQMGETGDAA